MKRRSPSSATYSRSVASVLGFPLIASMYRLMRALFSSSDMRVPRDCGLDRWRNSIVRPDCGAHQAEEVLRPAAVLVGPALSRLCSCTTRSGDRPMRRPYRHILVAGDAAAVLAACGDSTEPDDPLPDNAATAVGL